MMFKKTVIVSHSKDIEPTISELETEIDQSNLAPYSANFLKEQIETTLLQFRRQLDTEEVRRIKADRLFEGDGYKVILRLRSGQLSPIDKIKKFIGIG